MMEMLQAIRNLPWEQGITESGKLGISLINAIIAKNGGTTSDRVPMVGSGIDVVVFIVFTLGLLAINWGVRFFIVQPFARVILRGPPPTGNMTAERQRIIEKKIETKVQKFGQTAMEQLFYGSFTYFGMIMVLNQPWAWPSKHWWLDFDKKDPSGHSIHSYMTEAVAAYYILYAARYFQGMLSVLMEHRRKDFWEMMLHHFVTWALVTISYVYGWNRVGLVIMLVFDPADVPLHTAKMCKYIGEQRCPKQASNFYQYCSDGLFVVFLVSFFITRLVIFPYICWSAHIEATIYFPKKKR
jgi:ceramide synthetase